MKVDQNTVLWGLAGVAGAYFLGKWIVKDAAGEVGKAAQAINPVNHDNVFNKGANSLYQAITGSSGTIGTDIADWLHPVNFQPVTIVDKAPPESSQLPYQWYRDTPGPSGQASVTKTTIQNNGIVAP